MVEIKGFITNLGRYNEGELVGKWVEFPIYENALESVFEDIGINDEYEEYFFTDWDCSFEHNFGEYELIDDVNEIAEQLLGWDEDLLSAVCENWGVNYAIDNGEYDFVLYSDIYTDYDLGYYWVHDSGCYNLDEMGPLANYIDYESFGRDIRFETDGAHTSWGWVEYRG